MRIWTVDTSIDDINQFSRHTMVEHLDIQVVELGDDYIKATMPVDHRTHQPMGILHGGASVALAETLGSIAANLTVPQGRYCVGLDINANHIRSVKDGRVSGVARPVHLGRSTQVWEITIRDEADRTVCVSRLTMAVLGG